MDFKNLLEQVLQTSKDNVEKGKNYAENKLNIPKEGAERDATMSGLKTGAAAAGVLALLLGTKTGRAVGGSALKVGSVAALGGLAYQMYKKWQTDDNTAQAGEPAVENKTALDSETLLRVMVSAAKADGHVDEQELAVMRDRLAEAGVDENVNDMLLKEMVKATTVEEVAALANDDKQAAIEIYLVSRVVIDEANEAEQAYLAQLQKALGLPDEVVAQA